MLEFNPFESKLLFSQPRRLHRLSAWNEHVPFAMLLVELQRPRSIVELGTHWGISYCAFCQAVEALGSATACRAVDTWAGDVHAGAYGEDVYENLKVHHRPYEPFSQLLRMTFDAALEKVPNGSVDLLHIDGLHTYEAVKRDYETWRPKLSESGIVLFHDTMVKEREFGVHRLWAEISPALPNFNFEHGYGLGVLAVGPKQPDSFNHFLQTANSFPEQTRSLFVSLGRRLQADTLLKHCEQENSRLRAIEVSKDYHWGKAMVSPLRKLKRLFQ